MSYQGDYLEDYATLNFKFPTRTTTGAPTTLAGTPVISVYKANGLVQSVAGITLTVDFDGVTGLNNVLIDLSADAFYAVANDYQIVITAGTVGGVSVVGEVVGTFSIENRFEEVTLAAKTHTSAVIPTVSTVTDGAKASALTTAQNDLDTITGSDGVALASTQQSIVFQPIEITAGNGIPNIELTGSGSADGLEFSRAGSGGLFDTNWAAAIESEVNDALVAYDPATGTEAAAIKAETALIVEDTNELQTNQGAWATATGFATEAKQDIIDTVVDGNATAIAALNDVSVADVLTTQMTEAYAADGTAPTLAQALFLINSTLNEFAIVGTTVTNYKLDGTTPSSTHTLDSSTVPTSKTRSS